LRGLRLKQWKYNFQQSKYCGLWDLICSTIGQQSFLQKQKCSNPAVLALLEMIWLLFESKSNNETLRELTIRKITVMSLREGGKAKTP
jgi:hypothetical protein